MELISSETKQPSSGLRATKRCLTGLSILMLFGGGLSAGCYGVSDSTVFLTSPFGVVYISMCWLVCNGVIGLMRIAGKAYAGHCARKNQKAWHRITEDVQRREMLERCSAKAEVHECSHDSDRELCNV